MVYHCDVMLLLQVVEKDEWFVCLHMACLFLSCIASEYRFDWWPSSWLMLLYLLLMICIIVTKRRSNPRTHISRYKTGLGVQWMEALWTQFVLNSGLLLFPSMTRVVVAVVKFEGRWESLKKVESLLCRLLSSVLPSLGAAISRDTLGEVLSELAARYFTVLPCIILRLPPSEADFSRRRGVCPYDTILPAVSNSLCCWVIDSWGDS